jgi:hypothetical protein
MELTSLLSTQKTAGNQKMNASTVEDDHIQTVQRQTYLRDGIHKKSDDIKLLSASENSIQNFSKNNKNMI